MEFLSLDPSKINTYEEILKQAYPVLRTVEGDQSSKPKLVENNSFAGYCLAFLKLMVPNGRVEIGEAHKKISAELGPMFNQRVFNNTIGFYEDPAGWSDMQQQAQSMKTQ